MFMLDKETILKVLALFDDEDIQYIHSDKLDESIKQEYIEKQKVKVKSRNKDEQGK